MVHPASASFAAGWANMSSAQIAEQVRQLAEEGYDNYERQMGAEQMRRLERLVMLQVIENRWVHHLTSLDELREGIGLRAVGQRNPLVEYKREAFGQFESLLDTIKADVASFILNVRLQAAPSRPRATRLAGASSNASSSAPAEARHKARVGRNDPCPCGSGKKFKACCMRDGLSPEEAAAKAKNRAPAGAGGRPPARD
jgi:preprotein translocase subunit SecA